MGTICKGTAKLEILIELTKNFLYFFAVNCHVRYYIPHTLSIAQKESPAAKLPEKPQQTRAILTDSPCFLTHST